MSRPRHRNIIAPSRWPDVLLLECLTSRAGCSPLTEYAFDAKDLQRVQLHHWSVGPDARAVTHVGKGRRVVYLSRWILDAGLDERVYHLNGDVQDLRRVNLFSRPCLTPRPKL